MATIRTLIFAAVIMTLFMYSMVGFFGGYQYTNGIASNQTLSNLYHQTIGNLSSNSNEFYLGKLTNQTNVTRQGLINQSNPVLATFGALGYASSFIGDTLTIVFNIGNFLAPAFEVIGIPAWLATAASETLFLLAIVLTLLSALFIFPL